MFVPTVSNPIPLKEQRFKSDADYKRKYYVSNESNYAVLIYEGTNSSGKVKRSFRIISNIEAAGIFKAKHTDVFPANDENGYSLLYALKTGTMVLFYEKDKSELLNLSQSSLSRRLYKTLKFSTNSIICFIFHQEARPVSEIEYRKGQWLSSDPHRPIIAMSTNQVKVLVEGIDFRLSTSGEITFI